MRTVEAAVLVWLVQCTLNSIIFVYAIFLILTVADQSTRDLLTTQRLWGRAFQVEGNASKKT